jgi:hypothetical protein
MNYATIEAFWILISTLELILSLSSAAIVKALKMDVVLK